MKIAISFVLLLSFSSFSGATEKSNSEFCNFFVTKSVSLLAGSEAIDCGFVSFNTPKYERSRIINCAKNAVKNSLPFKFGYESFGDDSSYCDIAVRNSEGRLLSIYFDSDSTGGNGGGSTISVSECEKIEFRAGTIGKGSFFELVSCKENSEMIDKILSK